MGLIMVDSTALAVGILRVFLRFLWIFCRVLWGLCGNSHNISPIPFQSPLQTHLFLRSESKPRPRPWRWSGFETNVQGLKKMVRICDADFVDDVQLALLYFVDNCSITIIMLDDCSIS